jgi:UDP-N-acetylmuramoyl-tripeptide--D-alanyl-D-alanine ligase
MQNSVARLYWILFYVLYLPIFLRWFYSLDKKLVLTKRVQRYMLVSIILFICYKIVGYYFVGSILFVLLSIFLITYLIEKIIFLSYKKKAIQNLRARDKLIVIVITASYGKTSMKNYLHQVLDKHYNVYSSPKSTNTDIGIIQDINNNLPNHCDIYIAEAGARHIGDIKKIVDITNPDYVILGKIGDQHIEYFKNRANIIKAKLEILKSKNIKKAFIHHDNKDYISSKNRLEIVWYSKEMVDISSNLDGISFEFKIDNKLSSFTSPVLGSFNISNLSAVILVSLELNVHITQIQQKLKNLTQTKHRLELIQKTPKLIIDDSYNSNLDGMLEAIRICSAYNGRKIIVTPGLVESSKDMNIKIAKKIDMVFDMVIITGELNSKLISSHILKTHKIILKNKEQLQSILESNTNSGDLILFANDAPNFI